VIPKAPVQAQIIIGLLAVLAIAYGASIMRLSDSSSGTRWAVPGQLIVVGIEKSMYSMTTSDPWVVKPISVNTAPVTRAYFLALKPGRATLRAYATRCTQCLSQSSIWQVEIRVWPSG
jgi:hypothetical protein